MAGAHTRCTSPDVRAPWGYARVVDLTFLLPPAVGTARARARGELLAAGLSMAVGRDLHVEIATDYAELTRRCDRHVAHEFGRWPAGAFATAKWYARAAAIAVSPLVELLHLQRLTELPDWRARWLAWMVLARLRFYRGSRMVKMSLQDDAVDVVERWNRGDAPTGSDPVEMVRRP